MLEKEALVQDWVNNDLLQLASNNKDIIGRLLQNSASHQSEILKLVEIYATFPAGRAYILSENSKNILQNLIDLLKSDQKDTPSKQSIVLTLQRLSLR